MSFPKPGQPTGGALVAPLVTDPRQWQHLTCGTTATPPGRPVAIRTGDERFPIPGTVVVQSYRDVYTDYRQHPETKAATSSGDPVLPGARGLLGPATITATGVDRIGKKPAGSPTTTSSTATTTSPCSTPRGPAADAQRPAGNGDGAQTYAENGPHAGSDGKIKSAKSHPIESKDKA